MASKKTLSASVRHVSPFQSLCLPSTVQITAHAEVVLLSSGAYRRSDRDGSDLHMHLAVARATMFSRCTSGQFGGDIGNGGC